RSVGRCRQSALSQHSDQRIEQMMQYTEGIEPTLMSQQVVTENFAGEKLTTPKLQIAATSFLNLFSLVGLSFYGLPFFYDFWVNEFGWTRTTVTSGNAFGKIVVGPLFGFIAGWVIDRFGPRRMMIAGVLMGGLSLIGLSGVTALWMFYL